MEEPQCVVLLHGLARTAHAMKKMETALEKTGYTVVNQGYSSTKTPFKPSRRKPFPLL